MTPRAAARRFVGELLRTSLRDVLDLIYPPEPSSRNKAVRLASYRRVESAVRRDLGFRKHDDEGLRRAVIESVPSKHRAALEMAVDALEWAAVEKLTVKEQAAYLIGIEIGRAVRRDGAR